MVRRIWLNVGALIAVMSSNGALAQDVPTELTPAGKAILQDAIARDRQAVDDRSGLIKPTTFPLSICAFPGGLCGAIHRDGTIAVPPRYDWVGTFSENRAAVRVGGLYGFVDDEGREVVKPQYHIVGDYKFGFAQVDVNGKSGLIDRNGEMVIAPTYGFIEAIAPDRFRVSELRQIGGVIGAEDFSGHRVEFIPGGGIRTSGFGLMSEGRAIGVIDITGQPIEAPVESHEFDKDDPSLRWVRSDKLWGLARRDGSWLIEPKFQEAGLLLDGLARVTVNGKVGFIDRTGHFAIEPTFDKAWWFQPGLGRTWAERDGIVGVIDKTGSWVFGTNYQQITFALGFGKDRNPQTFGWHFKNGDLWGLLDLDGRVVLGAQFDQPIQHCADGRLAAYKNKEWLYFKGDGSPLQPPEGRLVDATCGGAPPYTLKIGDKFGLVDARSNPLTPVQFDAIVWAGPAAKNVKIGGKWGRIGLDGSWLLEPKFDYLSAGADYRSGGADIIVASIDGKRGFLHPDTSWLIEPKFEAAKLQDSETAFVTISGATGTLRLKDQSWVVPPRPGVMCPIGHAIMLQADGKRAILSRTGETWIDIGAERVGINLDSGLLTFLKNGKWGLVDTAGHVTFDPQFDAPVFFTPAFRGIAWAKRDGKWCAIDRHGHVVPSIPCSDADPAPSALGPFQCKVEH
jgi:hypothetical protein